jgi:amino acid transporter
VATNGIIKRVLLGRPLRSDRLGETELPKSLALPVFCSDPLSSVAYATEEILLVLGTGGLAYLTNARWIALAIAALLVIVVASYRQTVYAYPGGGGAYVVAGENLGPRYGLTAAAALLVDYVLTVAVSVVAGVAAITRASPALAAHRVALSVGFVVLLTVVNLRGVKESGKAFALPTYGFVVLIYVMFAFAGARLVTGSSFSAESSHVALVHTAHTGGLLTVFLLLRAFASGCTALTGVEAVGTGVPAFRRPKSRNAAQTLMLMGVLAVSMFGGITYLAIESHVHATADQSRTVLAQISAAAFGGSGTLGFYLVQAFTAGILVLAANTAFNGFPILTSILAHDSYLPRQLRHRGDRLVFSNGVALLAGAATVLIIAFDAQVSRIIQLYIIGVFLSFTLSQAGMVRHQSRRGPRLTNLVGALVTGAVLVIVTITKLTHGAWIVFIAMPALFVLMRAIRRHYDEVEVQLRPQNRPVALPGRVRAIVLVSRLHQPTLRAVAYEAAGELAERWQSYAILKRVPLRIVAAPYRDLTAGVVDYVRHIRQQHPGDLVVVHIPEYVVHRWWHQLLHNQAPLRIKARLLFERGVTVTSVPFQLGHDDAMDSAEGPALRS